MGYFLFIDESGQDRREAPYEVLVGISVQDSELWNLIQRIQLADLVAYITSWGVRVSHMQEPARQELQSLADQVCQLRYKALRPINNQEDFVIWSFAVIDDLRPREEI